jgi:hypothetical protein
MDPCSLLSEQCGHDVAHGLKPYNLRIETRFTLNNLLVLRCRNINVAPSTVPGSDGQLPLMSSIHDGIHSTSANTGPHVQNCSFVGIGECCCRDLP